MDNATSFTLREAVTLLTLIMEARYDRHDRREGLREIEDKLALYVWNASKQAQDDRSEEIKAQ